MQGLLREPFLAMPDKQRTTLIPMHELSIALSLLDLASEQADRLGATVVAVRLKLGPLSGVVEQALLSAWELARENSDLPDARLDIQSAPLLIRCPSCDAERPAISVQDLCCAVCGTPAIDVVTGRELEITHLEVIDQPPKPGRVAVRAAGHPCWRQS